jgi:hypothetical protein
MHAATSNFVGWVGFGQKWMQYPLSIFMAFSKIDVFRYAFYN